MSAVTSAEEVEAGKSWMETQEPIRRRPGRWGLAAISGIPAVGLQSITGGMQVTGFNESPSPNYQSLKCPYRES